MEFRNDQVHSKGSVKAGVLLALLAPVLSLLLLYIKYPILLTGEVSLSKSEIKSLTFQIVSLGLLINAGLFFLFLKRQKEMTARGILSATLLLLLVAVFHKYLL